jgi:hypothetical protein
MCHKAVLQAQESVQMPCLSPFEGEGTAISSHRFLDMV